MQVFFSFIHFQESDVHENQIIVNSTVIVNRIDTLIPSPVQTLLLLRERFAKNHIIN